MELLVFGHAGFPVLVFSTRESRFFDYENRGLVGIGNNMALREGEAHRARYWREMVRTCL